MTESPNHYLLTRFNLPSKGHHEVLLRAQDNWLRGRVELFERFCLPSVRAQTCRDFSWIIYFDPQSPSWLRTWIDSHAGDFHPVFRSEVSTDDLLDDVRELTGAHLRSRLITTNLDNDDSLAVDFVARLQTVTVQHPRAAVYLADGLVRAGERLYRRIDRHNAFSSVNETWDGPVTCWSEWHNLLPRRMPAVVVRGEPAWIQVIHGGNVSNRVRGRLTTPGRHRARFPGLLDQLPDPAFAAVARDRLLAVPARALGEAGRAAAKQVLTRVGGKQGLDRAKAVVADVRAARSGRGS